MCVTVLSGLGSPTVLVPKPGTAAERECVVVKMASLKVDNFLKPFRGKSDDFTTFWSKFQIICKLHNLSTERRVWKCFRCLSRVRRFTCIPS